MYLEVGLWQVESIKLERRWAGAAANRQTLGREHDTGCPPA